MTDKSANITNSKDNIAMMDATMKTEEIVIPVTEIKIKSYYVGSIPCPHVEVFKLLGIKFVKIMDPTTSVVYYVYEKKILEVIEALKLCT